MNHYNARTGVLSTWDERNKIMKALPVGYIDQDKQPGDNPLFPNEAYINRFARAAYEAMDKVNNGEEPKMIFDKNKHPGFDGEGFFQGHLTFAWIREDKELNWDYRYALNDRDSVNIYEARGYDGLVAYIVSELAKIQAKRG